MFFAEIVKEAFAIKDYELKIEFVPQSRTMKYGEKEIYDKTLKKYDIKIISENSKVK